MVSCGSSEILRAAANAQLRSRGRLVAASPTSEWFAKYCQRSNAEIVTVPLTNDYAHDLDAMLARSRFWSHAGVYLQSAQSDGHADAPARSGSVRAQAARDDACPDRRGLPSLRQPVSGLRVVAGPFAGRPTRHRDPQLLQDSRAGRLADRVRGRRARDGASASTPRARGQRERGVGHGSPDRAQRRRARPRPAWLAMRTTGRSSSTKRTRGCCE